MPQEKAIAQSALMPIALGSNLPVVEMPSAAILEAALSEIEARLGSVRCSRFYKTPAFPYGSGPDFVNAVCVLQSSREASEVLRILHEVEDKFFRERTLRWGKRTLDLDLLAREAEVHPDEASFNVWRQLSLEEQQRQTPNQLILPHPRIQDRAFVLVPLAEILPDWSHPVLNKTATEMRDALAPEVLAEVVPLQ